MSCFRVQEFVSKSEAEVGGKYRGTSFDVRRRRADEKLNYYAWENAGTSMMSWV